MLADTGYCSEARLEAQANEGCVSLGREGKADVSSSPESCLVRAGMADWLIRPEDRAVCASKPADVVGLPVIVAVARSERYV